VCFVFDEYACDWADDQSQTRRFAERYTREFVTRYRSRPIFWFWEFSNENNLGWDLPNAMEFLPEKQRDARNIARYYVGRLAIRAFADEVRRHDPSRPISSGCSSPRPSQFHLATTAPGQGSPWAADSFAQTATAASWTAPAPVDLLSIHYYEPFASYDAARVRRDLASSAEIAGRLTPNWTTSSTTRSTVSEPATFSRRSARPKRRWPPGGLTPSSPGASLWAPSTRSTSGLITSRTSFASTMKRPRPANEDQ
jgi:hypothetical protein